MSSKQGTYLQDVISVHETEKREKQIINNNTIKIKTSEDGEMNNRQLVLP